MHRTSRERGGRRADTDSDAIGLVRFAAGKKSYGGLIELPELLEETQGRPVEPVTVAPLSPIGSADWTSTVGSSATRVLGGAFSFADATKMKAIAFGAHVHRPRPPTMSRSLDAVVAIHLDR